MKTALIVSLQSDCMANGYRVYRGGTLIGFVAYVSKGWHAGMWEWRDNAITQYHGYAESRDAAVDWLCGMVSVVSPGSAAMVKSLFPKD